MPHNLYGISVKIPAANYSELPFELLLVCTHECMYVLYTYIRIYVCMYVRTVYIHTYIRMYVSMHIHIAYTTVISTIGSFNHYSKLLTLCVSTCIYFVFVVTL